LVVLNLSDDFERACLVGGGRRDVFWASLRGLFFLIGLFFPFLLAFIPIPPILVVRFLWVLRRIILWWYFARRRRGRSFLGSGLIGIFASRGSGTARISAPTAPTTTTTT
jgi:hypothetical protein